MMYKLYIYKDAIIRIDPFEPGKHIEDGLDDNIPYNQASWDTLIFYSCNKGLPYINTECGKQYLFQGCYVGIYEGRKIVFSKEEVDNLIPL